MYPSKSESRSHQEGRQRLFFALWPDHNLRQQLCLQGDSLLRGAQGRRVSEDNFHITLVFLGSVGGALRRCLEASAEEVACPPFELILDYAGHWPRSRALWLAPSMGLAPLIRLADQLQSGARACGLSLDDRPYRPHLTLMRKTSRAPENMSIEPLRWFVSRFVLVRSVSVPEGVRYEVINEWPLLSDT